MTTTPQPRQRKLRDTPKNRIIEVQRPDRVRDSLGGFLDSWASVRHVWAAVEVTGVSEEFSNDGKRLVARRWAYMRLHFIPGLNETWRIVYQGLPWDIEGIERDAGLTHGVILNVQTDVNRKP